MAIICELYSGDLFEIPAGVIRAESWDEIKEEVLLAMDTGMLVCMLDEDFAVPAHRQAEMNKVLGDTFLLRAKQKGDGS